MTQFIRAGRFRRTQSFSLGTTPRPQPKQPIQNPYEMQRAANMAANEEMLRSLGIVDAIKGFQDAIKPQEAPASSPAPMQMAATQSSTPAPVNYDHIEDILSSAEDDTPMKVRRTKKASSRVAKSQLVVHPKSEKRKLDDDKENPPVPTKKQKILVQNSVKTYPQPPRRKRLKGIRGKRVNAPVIRKPAAKTKPKREIQSYPVSIAHLRPDVAPLQSGDVPLCHHGEPCTESVSNKKNTRNYRRRFFKCARLNHLKPCQFFAWCNFDDPKPPVSVQPPVDLATTDLDNILHDVFGHSEFLPGQREAITKVIAGVNTLAILPTGTGKSLIYQLAAYVKQGVTIVISPLVALMQDQCASLPPKISGRVVCGSHTVNEQRDIYEAIKSGTSKILYISPEKYLSEYFHDIILPQLDVKLLCVDEAHCISEWSHNFRPAFLQIARSTVPGTTVLGLTATATKPVEKEVTTTLNIQHVIRLPTLRPNIQLSVSKDMDRQAALIKLLKTPMFDHMNGILIYVTMRKEAEDLCALLRVHNIAASAYHAGKTPVEREDVLKGFMAKSVRVVVATIAFGLGVDRSDIRSVIHYRLPHSVEAYVQETGRSGRDGLPAYCHVFLSAGDLASVQRFVHSDGVDMVNIKKLIKWIMRHESPILTSKVRIAESELPFVAIPKEGGSIALDIKQETIETVLVLLEQKGLVKLYPEGRSTVGMRFYDKSMAALAGSTDDPSGAVRALMSVKRRSAQGLITATIDDLARAMGVHEPGVVIDALAKLQKNARVHTELSVPAWLVKPVNNQGVTVDKIAVMCMNGLSEIESNKMAKAERVYKMLESVAVESVECVPSFCFTDEDTLLFGEDGEDLSTPKLQHSIQEYFDIESPDEQMMRSDVGDTTPPPLLRADTMAFLMGHAEQFSSGVTPRVLARIAHGISSPKYPAQDWYSDMYWRRFVDIPFDLLMQEIKDVLLKWTNVVKYR